MGPFARLRGAGILPPPPPSSLGLLHYFTEVRNLLQLLGDGALFSQALLEKGRKSFVNVSNANVQARRKRTVVPVAPGGVVHDYVPFYFAPRSPTMSAIMHAKDVAYQGGQERLIYLVSSAQAVAKAGVLFVFTDAHCVNERACQAARRAYIGPSRT